MLRLFFLLASLAAPLAVAQEKPGGGAAPAMQEIAPGVIQAGLMRVDRNTNSVTFPAKLNMTEGALEYLICTPRGPTHECLVVTDVQPGDLHFGMLLLGVKGAGITTPGPADAPPAQIDAEYLKQAPKLKGDNVSIITKWKDPAGKEQSAALENWVLNDKTRKPALSGPWIYTGSMFANEQFQAQIIGVIAATVTNPSALINNPRKGSDEQIWSVNTKAVPPEGTALELTIRLELEKPSK